MTLNRVIFVGSFIALSSLAEYVPGTYGVLFLRQIEGVTYYKSPGTPGSVWTKEETEIVRKKVIELMRYSNWSPDTRDGLFWTDGTLDGSRGISWVEEKWCKVRSSAHIHSKLGKLTIFTLEFAGLCLGQTGHFQEPDAQHRQAAQTRLP